MFSIKPLKVKLLAGEQKATEVWFLLQPHNIHLGNSQKLTDPTRHASEHMKAPGFFALGL